MIILLSTKCVLSAVCLGEEVIVVDAALGTRLSTLFACSHGRFGSGLASQRVYPACPCPFTRWKYLSRCGFWASCLLGNAFACLHAQPISSRRSPMMRLKIRLLSNPFCSHPAQKGSHHNRSVLLWTLLLLSAKYASRVFPCRYSTRV